jgi:membrane protein
MAGGVAFFVTLSLFPTLLMIVSLYGLVADASDVRGQLDQLRFLPHEVRMLLDVQLVALTRTERPALGIGLFASLLFALWAASGGMHALLDAVTLAARQRETRSWFRVRGLSLFAIIVVLAAVVFGVAAIAGAPILAERFGLRVVVRAMELSRWPALFAVTTLGIGALYRFAPSGIRGIQPHRWISWGSVLASGTWFVATMGFSRYVTLFANYNETYGALAGVIVLLTWLWISAILILSGAELDSILERRASGVGLTRVRGAKGHRRGGGSRAPCDLGRSASQSFEVPPDRSAG